MKFAVNVPVLARQPVLIFACPAAGMIAAGPAAKNDNS
jgi:hypothetical protein